MFWQSPLCPNCPSQLHPFMPWCWREASSLPSSAGAWPAPCWVGEGGRPGWARCPTHSSGSRRALFRRGTEDNTYATGALCCWQGLGPANPCRVVNLAIKKGVWQPTAAESQHWTPEEISWTLRRECCLLLSQAPGACMPTGRELADHIRMTQPRHVNASHHLWSSLLPKGIVLSKTFSLLVFHLEWGDQHSPRRDPEHCWQHPS